jgi:multidrug efflux pump
MSEGMPPREAYALAAQRMAGPVTAATLTRIAAFSPLLFWPGIVGQFMMYLPITLIATLSASLVTALIFTPTLGALIGRPQKHEQHVAKRDSLYIRIIHVAIRRPLVIIGLAIVLLVGVMYSYGRVGAGVEFFPAIEPDTGVVLIHARGNLSLTEKDQMVRQVEDRILDMDELDTIYARAGEMGRGADNITEDVIGQIQFSFIDWQERRPAGQVMDDIRARTADIPGIRVEVTAAEQGPPTGKPIQIQLASDNAQALEQAAREVSAELAKRPEVRDLDNGLPMPGIDWRLEIDKAAAARYGIGVGSVGLAVQLVTNGVKITDYRPPGTDKPVDIILRFPPDRRTLSQIDDLRVQTAQGSVPISNFIVRTPSARVGTINRVDGHRIINVTANLAEGVNVAAVQQQVSQELAAADFGGVVNWKLGGSNEEQAAAQAFLGNAFGAAIFLIFAILLLVFNKFSSVGLILSSIILSTIGVFLGLIIMNQPLSVVMTGVGIIALAGVITNNNIVLIDTYDRSRRDGMPWQEAILHTCRERARPVLLTAIAAVLGVLPIAFGVNIDFLAREMTYGAPSTQWWIQLSTAIVFGLSFATILTLIVTPASLAAIARLADWRQRRKQRRLDRRKPPAPMVEEPAEDIAEAAEEAPRLAAE